MTSEENGILTRGMLAKLSEAVLTAVRKLTKIMLSPTPQKEKDNKSLSRDDPLNIPISSTPEGNSQPLNVMAVYHVNHQSLSYVKTKVMNQMKKVVTQKIVVKKNGKPLV